jgi:hypothetical protein
MIEKIAQSVKDLRLGQPQGLSNIDDYFATLVKRHHMPHGHAQAVDHWLPAADPGYVHNVRMFCLYRF